MGRVIITSAVAAVLLALMGPLSQPARAQSNGLETRPSAYGLRETVTRFVAAVRDAGWIVFNEIDHSAAARDVGMNLPARTVVLFGNPRAGTGAMSEYPTLAIDLPMRVLIWQDDQSQVQVTRSTGTDIAVRVFARHGISIPAETQDATDRFISALVRSATE